MCEPHGVRRLVLVLLVMVAVAVVGPTPTQAQAPAPGPAPGEVLLELCRTSGLGDIPELGGRVCASFEAGSTLLALLCDQLPLPAAACAALTDGRVIDTGLVDAFERSWLWRALRLQDRLDDGEPLRATLWPHTHNSSNSTAYAPSLANIDPNQRYSLTDQLRMGIRAVELDLHWTLNPAGTAESGGKAVVLCHGRTEAVGDLRIHLGCSVDRLLVDGLRELRSFLTAPGNEDEVVLLYLENQLDDDPLAHRLAADALASELGDLVMRPPAGQPCAELPMDRSVDELRAGGGRVLIVGNCGPAPWGTWVHERGDRWEESGSGGSYPGFPDCLAERTDDDYDHRLIRYYEDSTWLTAIASGPSPRVSPDDIRSMVRCGVDLVGVDRLEPFDGRLDAMVWSWAPDEPVDDPARRCVGGDADGRFRMAPCGEARRATCRTTDGTWVVPATATVAADAAAACAAAGPEAGVEAELATPPTGWENERLRAAAGGDPVWLSLTAADAGLAPLTPLVPPAAPNESDAPVAPPVGPGSTSAALPATGATPTSGATLLVLATAFVLRQLRCAFRR